MFYLRLVPPGGSKLKEDPCRNFLAVFAIFAVGLHTVNSFSLIQLYCFYKILFSLIFHRSAK